MIAGSVRQNYSKMNVSMSISGEVGVAHEEVCFRIPLMFS